MHTNILTVYYNAICGERISITLHSGNLFLLTNIKIIMISVAVLYLYTGFLETKRFIAFLSSHLYAK